MILTPTATRQPDSGPLTYLGRGSGRTQSFHLRSGLYAISWEARPALPSGIGCSVRGSLQTTDGRQVNSAFEGQVVPGENLFTGVESGYTVSSGEYVLDISSDCVWSVTVSMTRS